MEILCFFAGTVFVYVNKVYPLILVLLFFYFRQKLSYVLWFVAAIGLAIIHQWLVAEQGMPKEDVIKYAVLTGRIVSIPAVASDKTQFQFDADSLNGEPVKAKILLNCYNHCPNLQAGQYWQINTKIKRPRNLGNPGAFNYTAVLHSRHINWTGFIRPAKSIFIESKTQKTSILVLRQYLANKLAAIVHDEKSLGIIQALSLGITTHIDKAEWELFRRTGTIHLMVISGAHIGLVAGIVYGLIAWIWCRMGGLCLRIPAPKIASAVALFVAFIYLLLSGFAVPAERATIVCFFMLIRNFCNQRFTIWQAWRYALLIVIVTEPHSVMLSGFYLSFLAVAILVLTNQRIDYQGIRKTLALQCACLVGLMPLTLYWFSYGASNGLIANLIAIPWVGFIIVPLALLTTLLAPLINIPLMVNVLKFSISALLIFLNWVDSIALINLTNSFSNIFPPLILMTSIAIFVFLPIGSLLVATSLMAVLVLFPAHSKPKNGEVDIHLIDVGQGLSLVVNTTNHTLVYDTGAKFYRGGDMGKMALIPYFKFMGINRLDAVVISHPDSDHRGGLDSLIESYTIDELIVDDPDWYHQGKSCYEYPPWNWDGVQFRFFPTSKSLPKKNNHSCVLQISTRGGQVLLTGDIEKLAEDYLIEHYGREMRSSVMLLPHHASKSSSSERFVDIVRPRQAIVSYGFDNQYYFPHFQALEVYKQRNIPIYNTSDCGMVSFTLKSNSNSVAMQCYSSRKELKK